jgi:hypothetical protein
MISFIRRTTILVLELISALRGRFDIIYSRQEAFMNKLAVTFHGVPKGTLFPELIFTSLERTGNGMFSLGTRGGMQPELVW